MRLYKKNLGENLRSRLIVKNWLPRKSDGESFSADKREETEDESDGDYAVIRQEEKDNFQLCKAVLTEDSCKSIEEPKTQTLGRSALLRAQSEETLWTSFSEKEELKLFVGTWNVAGEVPPENLDLHDWLDANKSADMYVLGFQEIVPLNAGNVLGNEDSTSAVRWDNLIRKTLNKKPCQRNDGGCSAPPPPSQSPLNHRLLKAVTMHDLNSLKSEVANSERNQSSVVDGGKEMVRQEDFNSDLIQTRHYGFSDVRSSCDSSIPSKSQSKRERPQYVRVASKQMVGIFISVWIRRRLRRHIGAVRVSTVGCGIMGYLRNKGSVSVSLSYCHTSFCFICTHLSSGQKEGDELRRNADLTEILLRTQFPCSGKFIEMDLPENIFSHDRIICLGDLNYRLSIPEESIKSFIGRRDWVGLMKKDQLKLEQSAGRAFVDWHEGTINFAPTYKYIHNSCVYYGMQAKQCEKRRAPAWCDRILWYGKGLKELEYDRSESKLSDHRPVRASFMAEVESISKQQLSKTRKIVKSKTGLSDLFMGKVEVPRIYPQEKILMDNTPVIAFAKACPKLESRCSSIGRESQEDKVSQLGDDRVESAN